MKHFAPSPKLCATVRSVLRKRMCLMALVSLINPLEKVLEDTNGDYDPDTEDVVECLS